MYIYSYLTLNAFWKMLSWTIFCALIFLIFDDHCLAHVNLYYAVKLKY